MLQNAIKITYSGNWEHFNGYYQKVTMFFAQINSEELYNSFVIELKTVCSQYKNVVEEKFSPRNRSKGEKPSDYVASMVGINNGKQKNSYYTETLPITLPSGEKTIGKIRISDHKVDPGTFAKNNDVDVCISIVVGEVERKYPDENIDEGREITVIEYVLDKKFANKERVLIDIADKIVKTTIGGWNQSTDIGLKNQPNISKHKGAEKINEEFIRQIVREEIEKYFNR